MCTISNHNLESDFLNLTKILVRTLLFSGREVLFVKDVSLNKCAHSVYEQII